LGLLPLALLVALAEAPQTATTPRRVVLLVVRGTSFEHVPDAARLAAMPVEPIDGAVTAASLASLFTGARPERHGLVGNVYREGFGATERDAFEHRMLAEPLWEAASRQGLRVATLNLRLPGFRHDGVVAEWVLRPGASGAAHDAAPPAFARDLDREAGPPPVAADLAAFLEGRVSGAVYASQVEAWALHRRAVIRYAVTRLPFDLLVIDENVVDALLHPFLGRDESCVRRAVDLANGTIASVIATLPRDAVLVVVSPYGMAPVSELLPLAGALTAAGYNLKGPLPAIEISAYGPVAHLYLAPGVEPAAVADALRRIRGHDGMPWLDVVETRLAPRLPLFHSMRGGDVIALARPGVVLSSGTEGAPPRFSADHGHRSSAPGQRGFLYVHAPGMTRRTPGTLRDIDVAPSVARLLGVLPPAGAQGGACAFFDKGATGPLDLCR
jgi:hypothetical protein